MKSLTSCKAWNSLKEHAQAVCSMGFLDIERCRVTQASTDYEVNACGVTLDYSKQRITSEGLLLLLELADSCALHEKINALIRGDIVNTSENRPALHTALRAPDTASLKIDGYDVMHDIVSTRGIIKTISHAVRDKMWCGYSGKAITDVVNIGMGGSDLGAKFCVQALKHFATSGLGFHFISDADPVTFRDTVASLNPETTLFIISSKSFTTEETLYNAQKAKAWIGKGIYSEEHFIAVTACPDKAKALSIKTILPIWDWVGGRYSSCSAMNLITAIAIGYDAFECFLQGAHAMDIHFHSTPFDINLPVLSGLMGVWNNNFLEAHTLLMLTYAQRLKYLVGYVQQLDMESNGKSVDKDHQFVQYATGPIIWGGDGNQAQHSYYQLLCQGTHKIATEFISVRQHQNPLITQFCEAKQEVLSKGMGLKKGMQTYIRGGIPVMHIQLEQCSPYELGALISFYEHKVYTQSVIWNINAFDQPGVEVSKKQVNYDASEVT